MKVKFVLLHFPFINETSIEIRSSIIKKFDKTIDFLFVPTKEMVIDLDSFLDLFELGKSQMEHQYINDYMFYDINKIVVCNTYLELWLILQNK
jgi:hypothetical protein